MPHPREGGGAVSARDLDGELFHVSPENFGAVGNGVADDTSAVQQAVNEAIYRNRTLVLKPRVTYKVTATIDMAPAGVATSYRVRVHGAGPTPITWAGGNGTDAARVPVFRVQGMKRSCVEHINIQIPASCTYVHGWELDNVPGVAPAGTYGSLSQVTFGDCHVFGSTGNTGCGGWRIGHADTADSDFSFIQWENCGTAFGVTAPASSFHILQEGSNALNNVVIGGYAYFCDVGIGNLSSTGAFVPSGAGSIFVKGFGSSHTNTDFQFRNFGNYEISGGRFEVGKRFLDCGVDGSTIVCEVTVKGVRIVNYTPADGIVFNSMGSTILTFEDSQVDPTAGAQHSAAMFTVGSSSNSSHGTLTVRNCMLAAAEPFTTLTSNIAVLVEGNVQLLGATGRATAKFKDVRVVGSLGGVSGQDHVYVMNGLPGNNSGTSIYTGYQPSTLGAAPRVRVGWDSAYVTGVSGGTNGAACVEAVSTRDTLLRSNSRNLVIARSDGQVQFGGGLMLKRTLPGAYPYTILPTDHYVPVSTGASGRHATLPSAATAGAGREVIVKDSTGGASANNFTIDRAGSDTIDGATTKVISTNYGVVRLVSDGVSSWEVL